MMIHIPTYRMTCTLFLALIHHRRVGGMKNDSWMCSINKMSHVVVDVSRRMTHVVTPTFTVKHVSHSRRNEVGLCVSVVLY